MPSEFDSGDWYWDIDRQVAVRLDNSGRHDLLIGPYANRADAEVWMPTAEWSASRSDDSDGRWADVNSAYD